MGSWPLQPPSMLFGWQVGVSPEEMISLLDSGCDIYDLLVFMASKHSGVA